jgi:DHA1 family inner membrane transport protein
MISRANLVLSTLFLGMFVLGSAELLVVGVLDLVAADLGVSIPTAGTLVTGYALGLAIGGPVLTALTIRLDRRTVLVGTLVLFVLANLVAVLVASYGLFLAARVVTGALQGLFIAAAFATGIAVVPAERIGRAMSVVVAGVAVSAALGVPLGTLLGHALGWRGSFAAVVVGAVLALLATAALVPGTPGAARGGAGDQVRHALASKVLAVLGLTALVFASLYAALTYIVPFLEEVTGISGAVVSVFLLVFGVATAAGSFGGGRFADRNAARATVVTTVGAAFALAALYLVGALPVLVALVLFWWGAVSFGMVPSLQYRVVSLAGPGGALAQSLPASAANIGIAAGSLLGGLSVESDATAPVLTGLVLAVVAIPVAWVTGLLKPTARAAAGV